MHQYSELVLDSTLFTLQHLKNTEINVIESLNKTGSSRDVKSLQMLNLQKVITSIGIFSLFESMLQGGLSCKNGFEAAKKNLIDSEKVDLYNRFHVFYFAINVLKHGRGKSYNELVNLNTVLPFRIKMPSEHFFNGLTRFFWGLSKKLV